MPPVPWSPMWSMGMTMSMSSSYASANPSYPHGWNMAATLPNYPPCNYWVRLLNLPHSQLTCLVIPHSLKISWRSYVSLVILWVSRILDIHSLWLRLRKICWTVVKEMNRTQSSTSFSWSLSISNLKLSNCWVVPSRLLRNRSWRSVTFSRIWCCLK